MDSRVASPLRRIFVPLDGSDFSEQALPYARAIGGSEGELVFLQVVPKAEAIFGLFGNQLLSAAQVQRAYEEGARKDLERLRQNWIRMCPNIVIEIAVGDYADEIMATSDRHAADLIVMATHGRGGLDRWIIGSVADRVSRTSPIPVLLIHPQDEIPPQSSEWSIKRLIVPLDGSDLATQALPFAGRLAAQLNVPVTVVNVSDLQRQLSAVSTYGTAISQHVYDELIAQGRAEAEQTLSEAATLLQGMGVIVTQALLEGAAAKEIAGAAGDHDIIVMTSHGRGGLRRLFLGSVANQLVNQGHLPVVLVPAIDQTETSTACKSE